MLFKDWIFNIFWIIFPVLGAAKITFSSPSFESQILPDQYGVYRLEVDGLLYLISKENDNLFEYTDNPASSNKEEVSQKTKYSSSREKSKRALPNNVIFNENNFDYIYCNYNPSDELCLISKRDRLEDLIFEFRRVFFQMSECEEQDSLRINELFENILRSEGMIIPKIRKDRLDELKNLVKDMLNIENHKFKYQIPSACSSLKSLELNLRYTFKGDPSKKMFVCEDNSYIKMEIDMFKFRISKEDLNRGEAISYCEYTLPDGFSLPAFACVDLSDSIKNRITISIRVLNEEVEYLESEKVEKFVSNYHTQVLSRSKQIMQSSSSSSSYIYGSFFWTSG